MDHRYSERTETRIPALLRVNGCWVPTVIRNVSEGGLYAETATRLTRSSHAIVDVRFASRDGDPGRDFPALVIHRNGNGVGLMVMASEEEKWLAAHLRAPHAQTAPKAGFFQPRMR